MDKKNCSDDNYEYFCWGGPGVYKAPKGAHPGFFLFIYETRVGPDKLVLASTRATQWPDLSSVSSLVGDVSLNRLPTSEPIPNEPLRGLYLRIIFAFP